MKKSFKVVKAVLLLVCSFAILISCQKDKEKTAVKTKTELLTAGTWKYTASTVNPAYDYYGDGVITTDIFSIMKPCEKDDFEKYNTNGIWEYNVGPTTCDASDQTFTLPWHLDASETKMILGGVEHTILELTETSLKLRYTIEEAGVIYTAEDTYAH